MALRSTVGIMAAAVVLLLVTKDGSALQIKEPMKAIAVTSGHGKTSGILTDRLSRKQLRIWRSIENTVFAKDKAGRLLHPKLSSLWQWAETSGHAIYIELPDQDHSHSCEAGNLTIEAFDPTGHRHAAVLRLHLSIIDRASAGKMHRRADEFIPFRGLDKEERYAEVLGHELGHVFWTLGNPKYTQLYQELFSEMAELQVGRSTTGHSRDQEMRERLARLQSLVNEVEKPAESVEAEIWRELLECRGARAGAGL